MRWFKWWCILAALLAAALLFPIPSQAGEIAYTVKKGQTLSLICREVYGNKDLYTLVALYNGKEDPRKISPGETLRMPFPDLVTLRKGESLSSLAKRVWKDVSKYPVLAWANDISDPAMVPAGTRLAVPVMIPYRLPAGESVSSTAEMFYGDPMQYTPIITASGIENVSRVPAGSLLMVPYLFPRPNVKTTLSSRGAGKSPSGMDKEAMALLGEAEAAYRDGKYGEAWTSGHEASRALEGVKKARALRLMAACQYAFRRLDAAEEDLKAAYKLDPDYQPDPAYVNPEMMTLYERARGK